MDNDVIFCIALAMIGGLAIFAIITLSGDIYLSEDSAQDICRNLLQNSTIVIEAYSEDGKLVCETPSYDSTTNIIVRKAGERNYD